MKNIFKIASVVLFLCLGACTDLTLYPEDERLIETEVFANPESYKQYLAKLYAGFAVTGQSGPAGKGDIANIDEGFSNYLRQYWKAQELTTDEAVIGWNDGSLPTYHLHTWTASNEFVAAMFSRIFFQVAHCNEFLRLTESDVLDKRGNVSGNLRTEIQVMRAEARFIRALAYSHGIDMFGSIPLVKETDPIGFVKPTPNTRTQLFEFVESELKAIENELPNPKTGEYARADKAAAWALLAKMYLNAEVYTGQKKFTECITYCNKIISSNAFQLTPQYQHLFLADNHTSKEIIFPIAFDDRTRTWGGMTFLVHAAIGGSMRASDFGVDNGWGGLRVTPEFVSLFPDDSAKIDKRALFFRNGQNKAISNIGSFTDGLAFPKYKNLTVTGVQGKNITHPDTDFPVFRLADVYLMYAEAVLRGGTGGDVATAVNHVNKVRERAYQNTSGNVNSTTLTLSFILAERARELSWEGHRRTDLIRFGQFTEGGIWAWKGGVKDGKTTEKFRNLFPIPQSDLIANPNLVQNPGY
jgi:hypothetical protein